MKNQTFSRSKGFSLVSLMIASVIGIFISGAAGKVYVDSKIVFNARTTVSTVNENSWFALSDIRRTLLMTGRDIDPRDSAFPAIGVNGIVDAGASTSDSDTIAVNYASGISCGGDITALSTIRFLVEDNTLKCEKDGTKTPLVSGVHLMRVLYGVMDNPMVTSSASRYITANAVEDASQWDNVVSMRVGLIVSSDTSELPAQMRDSTVTNINLLGMIYTPPDTKRLYHAVSTTVVLRNLNPIISRQ